MVIETRDLSEEDYLLFTSHTGSSVFVHTLYFLLHDLHHFTNLSSYDLKLLIYVLGKKKFFFSDESSHMCLLLSQTVGFCSHSEVNSGL